MSLAAPVPDLDALDLLVSVAEAGSIRQASLRHGISQPAASMRIRSLERVLGLDLLERSTTGARCTPDGDAVVQWATGVLEAMRALMAGAAALRADQHSQLRLAASMTVAEYLMPSWLTRLRAQAPDVAVSLRMGNSDQVVEMSRRGEVDLGFVEGTEKPEGLAGRTVARDDLVVVVGRAHPWARRRAPVTPGDLAASPLVSREPGSGTRQVLAEELARRDLVPSALVELGSTTAIKAAVASGVGPAVLSVLAVQAEVADGRLVIVSCPQLDLSRAIRAVWRTGAALPAPARRLLVAIGRPALR